MNRLGAQERRRDHGDDHGAAMASLDLKRKSAAMRQQALMSIFALLFAGMIGDLGAVQILQPSEGERLEHIPDVPLFVWLGEKGEQECFEIFLDGQLETISCEEHTILSTVPTPGSHRLELVATFLPPAHGPIVVRTFIIFVDKDSPNAIPTTVASADGLRVEVPAYVDEVHKWFHSAHIWLDTTWGGPSALTTGGETGPLFKPRHQAGSKKWPADLWNYQEILHDFKPSLLLELGTSEGGSTLFFADVMKTVHREGTPYRILTVDIDRPNINQQVVYVRRTSAGQDTTVCVPVTRSLSHALGFRH